MSKVWHDKGEIEIDFPDEKFQQILQELNIKGKRRDEADYEKIFVCAFGKFLNGSLFLEEVAEIATYLFSTLSPKRQHETKLGDVLLKCSELIFYVRVMPENGSLNTFNWFMGDLMKYYREKTAKTMVK